MNDKSLAKELVTLKKLMDALTEGRQAKTVEPDDEDEAAFIASLNLLTSKHVIYAANVSESDWAEDGASNPHVAAVRDVYKRQVFGRYISHHKGDSGNN